MLTGTQNFSVAEAIRASGGSIPDELQANAQAVLEWLQAARDAIGGHPILVTSLYRSEAHNAAVPGHASNSQHLRALAADFDVLGISNHQAVALLLNAAAAGELPGYHQIITYTTDHHVHVGLVGEEWGDDRQALLETAVGQYATLTPDVLAQLAGSDVTQATQIAGQAVDLAAAHPVVTTVAVALLASVALLGGHWT